jgi:hypothetical protein
MKKLSSKLSTNVPNAWTGERSVLIGIVFSFAFTAFIWWLGPLLDSVKLLPDQGASWYLWKLPEANFWARATAWGFYLAHQFSLWGLIYYAQKQGTKYAKRLHPVNIAALGINAFFILLHVLQTHIWYDGLAQDVSVWSSQVSVVILLIWVILMENPRRGIFFGKKISVRKDVIAFAKKYHGYYFAWATIYTFWYHPTVSTAGHLIGFLYMFLLLVQGSLFFTRAHLNRVWTFVLELTVLVHGTLVAIYQGANLWPMFFFGFGGIFIITQMHGLGLSKAAKIGFVAAYGTGAAWVYSSRGWDKLYELIAIPLIDYVGVFALVGLISLFLWAVRKLQGPGAEAV